MPKQCAFKKAAQLSPQACGVLKWQREFWLVLIEPALCGRLGAPDLSCLEGFWKPAVVRHAVTTPELWHSFDKYNAEKPYHRQVRPFGFMVMFQQDEDLPEPPLRAPVKAHSCKRSETMLRVIAPFNRDPALAARQAFDRDTGKSVLPKYLKTYLRALRHYHDHPEAKFGNGERADRGPTVRRHIIVRSIRHIGKEANRLDSQVMMGIDLEAQAEFGVASNSRRQRTAIAKKAIAKFGSSAVARAVKISRQYLFEIMKTGTLPTEVMLCRIEQSLVSLRVARDHSETRSVTFRIQMEEMVRRIGLRQSAQILGLDAGHLSRLLSGRRKVSETLMQKVYAIQKSLVITER